MGAAFASTIETQASFGSIKAHTGTYTSSGSATGGDIDTGLSTVVFMRLTPKDTTVNSTTSVVNETIPCDGGAITIVTPADEEGTYMAVGW